MMTLNRLIHNYGNKLRGVGALAVVGIHIGAFAASYYNKTFTQKAILYIDIMLHFAVPLFITLSSYFLFFKYYKELDVKSFYRKRLNKIFVPYIFATIFYSLTNSILKGADFSLSAILNNFLTGGAELHLYFFVVIIEFYLVFPMIRWFLILLRTKPVYILICSYFLQLIIWTLQEFTNNRHLILLKSTFLPYIFYIILGFSLYKSGEVILKKLDQKAIISISIISIILGLVILVSWILNLTKNSYIVDYHQLYLVEVLIAPILNVALFIIILSLIVTIKNDYFNKLTERLGEISFPIYITHMFVITIASNYLISNNILPYRKDFYIALSLILIAYIYGFSITEKLVRRINISALLSQRHNT